MLFNHLFNMQMICKCTKNNGDLASARSEIPDDNVCLYVCVYGCATSCSLDGVANACKCCHLANACETNDHYTYSDAYVHRTTQLLYSLYLPFMGLLHNTNEMQKTLSK